MQHHAKQHPHSLQVLSEVQQPTAIGAQSCNAGSQQLQLRACTDSRVTAPELPTQSYDRARTTNEQGCIVCLPSPPIVWHMCIRHALSMCLAIDSEPNRRILRGDPYATAGRSKQEQHVHHVLMLPEHMLQMGDTVRGPDHPQAP